MRTPESMNLKSLEDIFSTEEERQDSKLEKVVEVPLEDLHPFRGHPFSVRDDEKMAETVESVKAYGVMLPGIARPRPEGGYEIVAGHRRKHACELAGLQTMPVVIRDLDDDSATIFMVDSNLQREEILPSERAAVYKMKLEAIKRQRTRNDQSVDQVGPRTVGKKQTSTEILSEQEGESATQIKRYVRLTNLVPELLDMVDNGRISLTPAVEISYLTPDEQALLVDTIQSEDATPSLSQAKRLRDLSKRGKLDDASILEMLAEPKHREDSKVVFSASTLSKYFPGTDLTPKQMEQAVLKVLDFWTKQQGQIKDSRKER